MANHVSSLKRARQTVTKTAVNRANRTRVRSSLRALREALLKGDATEAQTQYRATVSVLDKGVQKGVLHDNTASRYKSRLNARVKAVVLSTGAPKAAKATKSKAKAKA
jgi:small subunit ribosomal protein S20